MNDIIAKMNEVAKAHTIAMEKLEKDHKIRLALLDKMLVESIGIDFEKPVKMHIIEYRDDRVSCFSAEQTFLCYAVAISVRMSSNEYEFVAPHLRFKDKKGKLKKTPIHYNPYCSWELFQDEKLLLSHTPQSIIVDGKFTEDQIDSIRKICTEYQRHK